jgi:hypothetical protein
MEFLLKLFIQKIYSIFLYKQRPEHADDRLHAGIEASDNRFTRFTAQRDTCINT